MARRKAEVLLGRLSTRVHSVSRADANRDDRAGSRTTWIDVLCPERESLSSQSALRPHHCQGPRYPEPGVPPLLLFGGIREAADCQRIRGNESQAHFPR